MPHTPCIPLEEHGALPVPECHRKLSEVVNEPAVAMPALVAYSIRHLPTRRRAQYGCFRLESADPLWSR
jgi:hypothetical protein